MLLLLLGVRDVLKESDRRQVRPVLVDDSDGDHEDEFEGEEDQASLNGEGRFVPRGERRGRGFRTGLRW